jgi:superfamily I DNA and/or RNA helicase
MFLVTHSERSSKQSNPVEAEIIRSCLQAGARLGKLGAGSVGIVMPHRAQRALLKGVLSEHAEAVDVLDTVERLQGGERETVIVSATTSDPAAIGARAEFILNLNRANVAFSRAKARLIVVCAETLLSYIPAEVEHYQASVLWKSLPAVCTHAIGEVPVGPHQARLFASGD